MARVWLTTVPSSRLETNVSSRVRRVWGDVDGAFARAAHVVKTRVDHHRIAGVPMEPRGSLARPTDDGGLIVWASNQAPHAFKRSLSVSLNLDADRIRGDATVTQSQWGIKPYSAFAGALRLADEIRIEFDLAVPG